MDARTQEEPLYSQAKMDEIKQKEFREYLVKQDMVLAIVKFLLSLRNAKEKPDSPSQALIDYFGAYKDESWKEFEALQDQVNLLQEENASLEELIKDFTLKIQETKLEKERKEEEERQKELEAQTKKDPKKMAKK